MDSKGETARQPWHPNHGLAKLNLPLAKKVPEVPRLDTEQLRATKLLPVIWEIILRDFWGAILRPLVTPYRRWNANARV
jgi:hypothetical protein